MEKNNSNKQSEVKKGDNYEKKTPFGAQHHLGRQIVVGLFNIDQRFINDQYLDHNLTRGYFRD